MFNKLQNIFRTPQHYKKGNIPENMVYAETIKKAWYDNLDTCVFYDMFDYKETGRRMRPHYKHAPTRGIIRPWNTYDLTKKDWVDFCKGNCLAPLGIGCDLEPNDGVICYPKYGRTCHRGLITQDMIYREKIDRPVYDPDYTAVFKRMWPEEKLITSADLWLAKIHKVENKQKHRGLIKHRINIGLAA